MTLIRIAGVVLAAVSVVSCRTPDISVPAESQFVIVADEGSLTAYRHKRTGRCFMARGGSGFVETDREVCQAPVSAAEAPVFDPGARAFGLPGYEMTSSDDIAMSEQSGARLLPRDVEPPRRPPNPAKDALVACLERDGVLVYAVSEKGPPPIGKPVTAEMFAVVCVGEK